jgi:hypothetical protein
LKKRRITFGWRKASDHNHPSTYTLNKNIMNEFKHGELLRKKVQPQGLYGAV